MQRRSCGAPRSWRLRGGRCPWPIGRSCRTLGDRVSLSGPLGSGGWRLGPVRGGRNGTVLARVVGVCSVWVVLLCLCLYARQSHGILTVRGMGWWHAHRARRGRAHCSVDDGAVPLGQPPPLLSLRCACLRLTWCPSPGCLVHVSGLRFASSTLQTFLPPRSTRPALCACHGIGGGRSVRVRTSSGVLPRFHCLPVMVPAAAPLAGALAPSRCFSPPSR